MFCPCFSSTRFILCNQVHQDLYYRLFDEINAVSANVDFLCLIEKTIHMTDIFDKETTSRITDAFELL